MRECRGRKAHEHINNHRVRGGHEAAGTPDFGNSPERRTRRLAATDAIRGWPDTDGEWPSEPDSS